MTDLAITTRVFFAIDLPQNTKDAVESIILELKKYYPPKAVRWSKACNLHVTLHFLKEIRSVDRDKLIALAHKAAQHINSFELALGAPELFPLVSRPKIITLPVLLNETLTTLVTAIGEAIVAAGYPIEDHLFRGHVTLGRLNFGLLKRPVILPKIKMPYLKPNRIDEIILSHSELTPQGSQYTQLARFSLS